MSNRAGNPGIFVMDSNGANQTNLTEGSGIERDPAFSRDGTKIVFQSTRNGISEIYKMNADGSSQKRLTKDPGRDTLPDWGVAAQ